MSGNPVVTRTADGMFVVELGDRQEIVYIAGPPTNRWVFWNGHTFHTTADGAEARQPGSRGPGLQSLNAPMPATVVKVLVAAGAVVKKNETLVVLEAMKMELPIRALAAGTVKAVRCRQGELVQADQTLVEME